MPIRLEARGALASLSVVLPLLATPATAQEVALEVRGAGTWVPNSISPMPDARPHAFRWRWTGTNPPTQVVWQLWLTKDPPAGSETRLGEAPQEFPIGPVPPPGQWAEFLVAPHHLPVIVPQPYFVRVRATFGRLPKMSPWLFTYVSNANARMVPQPDLRCELYMVGSGASALPPSYTLNVPLGGQSGLSYKLQLNTYVGGWQAPFLTTFVTTVNGKVDQNVSQFLRLDPQGSLELTYSPTAISSWGKGTYLLTARVALDSTHLVTESNERNNVCKNDLTLNIGND